MLVCILLCRVKWNVQYICMYWCMYICMYVCMHTKLFYFLFYLNSQYVFVKISVNQCAKTSLLSQSFVLTIWFHTKEHNICMYVHIYQKNYIHMYICNCATYKHLHIYNYNTCIYVCMQLSYIQVCTYVCTFQ